MIPKDPFGKVDNRPARGWWAPGYYINSSCWICKEEYMCDKHSRICADCAYDPKNGIFGEQMELPFEEVENPSINLEKEKEIIPFSDEEVRSAKESYKKLRDSQKAKKEEYEYKEAVGKAEQDILKQKQEETKPLVDAVKSLEKTLRYKRFY